jgi:hypothetical protein
VTGVATEIERCANCREALRGEFCARCGQRARDLHRPFGSLISQAVEDLFSLDTRFLRTLGPLLLTPGGITRAYLEGRRVAFVPPLRLYLVAALVFFGLLALFPGDTSQLRIVMVGSPQWDEIQAAKARGEDVTALEFRETSPVFNEAYQAALARAIANPQAFGRAVFNNVPRTFFVLLPLFALLLELFYRSQGYYIEHLVFSLHYHAFVFSALAIRFVFGHLDDWMWPWLRISIGLVMFGWVAVYLPLALRRVYDGSWPKTLAKVVGLGFVYSWLMIFSMIVMTIISLARF